MSVVRAERWRRWTAVAVGAGVVAVLPGVWNAGRGAVARSNGPAVAAPPAATLLQRALRSDVPHSGLVETRGGMTLPDLPHLAPVSALAGGSVRARVWARSAERWRVDELTTTGEQDTYRTRSDLVTWDYEDDSLVETTEPAGVRLPRVDDLLPPQAARRLLAGVGPADRVTVTPGTGVVAGRPTWRLDVVPGDPRGTLSRLVVEVDRTTGLPLAVTVRGPGGVVALASRFVQLAVGPPPDAVLDPPSAPGARRETRAQPDPLADVSRFAVRRLPPRLAGFPRSPAVTDGTATYGTGLARFVVLPLPNRLGGQVMDAVRTGGVPGTAVPGGDVALLRSGVLAVAAAQRSGGGRVYLLSGTVRADALVPAARALLAAPRSGRR